jgi:hypothetical protein
LLGDALLERQILKMCQHLLHVTGCLWRPLPIVRIPSGQSTRSWSHHIKDRLLLVNRWGGLCTLPGLCIHIMLEAIECTLQCMRSWPQRRCGGKITTLLRDQWSRKSREKGTWPCHYTNWSLCEMRLNWITYLATYASILDGWPAKHSTNTSNKVGREGTPCTSHNVLWWPNKYLPSVRVHTTK